jgi:hypothetical protein
MSSRPFPNRGSDGRRKGADEGRRLRDPPIQHAAMPSARERIATQRGHRPDGRDSSYIGSVVVFDAQPRKLCAVGGVRDRLSVMKEACGSLACDESFDEHAATRSKLLEPDRNNSPMPGA